MQIGGAATNHNTASHPFTRRMNTGSPCTIAHKLRAIRIAAGAQS